jgi:hypothetical protein
MPCPNNNDSKNLPQGKLEDWLQMPDSDDESSENNLLEEHPDDPGLSFIKTIDPENEGSSTGDGMSESCTGEPGPDQADRDTTDDISDEEPVVPPLEADPPPGDTLPLFIEGGGGASEGPDEDTVEIPEEPGPALSDKETGAAVEAVIQAKVDDEGPGAELESLEKRLADEFRDTITGFNALTLPLGVILLILAALGWFLSPISTGLGFGGPQAETLRISATSAVIAALAGIHLLFYWTVHRISNSVKSRELDRLIEERREKRVCKYLDCEEQPAESGDSEPVIVTENLQTSVYEESKLRLIWKCTLYDTELEDFPVCAVCTRYEPVEKRGIEVGDGDLYRS